MKTVRTSVVTTLLCLAASILSAQQVSVQSRQQDLDFVSTQLPKLHANFFFQLTSSDFNQAVQTLQGQISALNDQEFYIRLAALVALPGDPHTVLYLYPGFTSQAGYRAFPLTFKALDDGIFVTGAPAAYSKALGTRLIAVSGNPIDVVLQKLGTVIAHTNQEWIRSVAEQYLRQQQVLQGLDLAPVASTTELTFLSRAGDQFTLAVGTESASAVPFPSSSQGTIPEYLQQTNLYYWFTYSADRRLLYFKYNSCDDMPGYPFSSFAADVLKAIDSNPVDTFVFDFRGNGGGNDALWSPLVEGIALRLAVLAANSNFRIYGVIDKGTFSAALYDAMQLKSPLPPEVAVPGVDTSKLFRVIGAPTGGPTGGYGAVDNFWLPSGLFAGQYSTKAIPTPDYIQPGPAFPPDIAVPVVSSDYFARHDPVLAAILARSMNPPATPSGSAIVVNGASFRSEDGVAAGSFASIFGTFPKDVDQVVFGTSNASIGYAGTSQINVVVPAPLAPGSTTISVRVKGTEVAKGTVTITPGGPGIFVAVQSDPSQPGAILNQDSSVNSATNRAPKSSVMQVYATGYGPLDSNNAAAVQVYIAGTPAAVQYSGPAPGYPGLWQINAVLPASVSGQVPLYIATQNIASNAVTIWVQ